MRAFTRIVPLAMLAVLMTFVISACSDDGTTTPEEAYPRVRLMHFRHEAPNYDMKMEYAPLTSNTAFARSSGFTKAATGNKLLSVFVAGTNDTVRESRAFMNAGKYYSLFMMGQSDTTEEAIFTQDSITDLNAGYSRLKIAHMSPDGPKFDVRIRTSNSPARWTNVEYGRVMIGNDLTPGLYELVLTYPNTTTTFRSYDGISLAAGKAYTMVVYGTMRESDGTDFSARLFLDDSTGNSVELVRSWQKATIHVLQAVDGLPPMTVTIDDTTKVNELLYAEAQTILGPTGERSLKYTAGGTDYVDRTIAIEGRREYTLILHGVPSQYYEMWKEETVVPKAGQIQVRFMNLSLDAGVIDVVTPLGTSLYDVPGMQDLSYGEISASPAEPWREFLVLPELPGNTYLLKIRKDGTTDQFLVEDEFVLAPNGVYTVFLSGSAAAGTLKLSVMTF
jgi:hypothetical protein